MSLLDFPFGDLREDMTRRNGMYRYWRVHAIIGDEKWVSSEMTTPAYVDGAVMEWAKKAMARRGRDELRGLARGKVSR